MAKKEHPQSRGMQRDDQKSRIAKKATLAALGRDVKVKLPKLPKFTKEQYETDDDAAMPIVEMTLRQWQCGVPRNPAQNERRDTERDITHLRTFVKEHATVRMGIYPDGRTCKIEGHSRGRLYYENPELVDRPPKTLKVECVPVRDDAHAAERFKRVDNRKTSKNATDDVYGAFRLQKISTVSKFFQKARGIKTPLQYAYAIAVDNISHRNPPPAKKRASIDDHVQVFAKALAALDGIDVNPTTLVAPFITAFLLAYVKYGNVVIPFFARINNGGFGRKVGKLMCPIAAIERERDLWRGGGQQQHKELTAQVLGALDTYMKRANFADATYLPPVNMQKVMKVDLKQYLVRAKSKRTGRTKKDGGGFTR